MRGHSKCEINNIAGFVTGAIFIAFAIFIIKFAPAILAALRA